MPTPTDVNSTYNGEEQDYFKANGASWYNETLFAADKAKVKVEYLNEDSAFKPIESGEYKLRLTIQNEEYIWANGKMSQDITFKINQKKLGVDFDPSTTSPTATPTNLCSRDSALADSILRIKYTTNAGYSDYTPPTGIDVYKAEVEIDTSVSNNYVLDDTYEYQVYCSTYTFYVEMVYV